MNEIWGKTVVGEETVKQRVKLLRQALGDSSSDPVYLEAVRGRGYRMLAEVTVPGVSEGGEKQDGKSRGLKRQGIFLTVLLGVMIAGAWWVFRPEADSEKSQRVAVLPFSFIGLQSEGEYVADGMTEEMITALAQLTDLPVIARTSVMQYKDSARPISDIALELDVGAVIEGSIQRFGDDLRVTVQMIDAASEEHYWAQTFDVSLADLPRVQVELAERVARSLAATVSTVGREAVMRNSTSVQGAYELYLKGRAAYRRWTLQDNETALAFYRQALELDPDYALAIAGLANALALKATEFGGGEQPAGEAIAAANRALSINQDLPEAHKALGIVSFHEGRYQSALGHYREALRLEPNYDEALFNLAETYQVLGRWDESVHYQLQDSFRPQGLERLSFYLRDLGFDEEADSIAMPLLAELPVSFFSDENRSLHYLLQGDIEKSREHARRMQDFFPNSPDGWMREGDIDLRAGDQASAEKNFMIAVNMPGISNNYAKLRLAQLLMERGETTRPAALLGEVEIFSLEAVSNGHEAWYHRWNMAFARALQGDREMALDWYEKAVDAGRRRFEWDEGESAFASIANEPRFRAALERQRNARSEMKQKVAQVDLTRSR
jgi:TolB-like protein/Flp pilus assembly protein TadD